MIDEQINNTTKRALIIRFGSLGDIVLILPVVQLLKLNKYEVHFFTKEKFKEIVHCHGQSDQIFTISDSASLSELFTRCRELFANNDYELVLDLHNNVRSFFVRIIAKLNSCHKVQRVSKQRIHDLFLFLLKPRVLKCFKITSKRKIEINYFLAKKHLSSEKIIENQDPYRLHFLNLKQVSIPNSFTLKRYVVINPESIWKEKQWSIDKFYEVAEKIIALKNLHVVLIASKKLENHFSSSNVATNATDLSGKTSIADAVSLIQGAAIVISNDSGIMHIAESQAVPVVSIFGPTVRELGFSTYRSTSQIVEKQMWCRPCSKSGKLCLRPFRRRLCLSVIQTGDVWDAVMIALNKI